MTRRLPRLSMIFLVALLSLAAPLTADEQKPAYPKTTAGLKKQTDDILAAAKAKDEKKLQALVKSLVLPQPEEWFAGVFGPRKSKTLAREYAALVQNLNGLEKLFQEMIAKGQTDVRVTVLEKIDDPAATGLQRQALASMAKPVPLYSVRMVKPGERYGMHLWSFAYVDGRFRIVGKMRSLAADVGARGFGNDLPAAVAGL